MTSLSRRKRQTTAPATPTTRHETPVAVFPQGRSWRTTLAAVGLVVAALMVAGDAAARAVDADSLLVPVSYSTGSNGARLVWLPYRPLPAEVRQARAERLPEATPADFQTPTEPTVAGRDDPMSDPFGDRSAGGAKSPRLAVDEKPFQPNFLDASTLTPPAGPAAAAPGADKRVGESSIPRSLVEQGLGNTTDTQPGLEKLPTIEDGLAANASRSDGCPAKPDFKPISELTTNIRATSGDFPRECPLTDETFSPRAWTPTTFTWKASGLCHKPLYFEDVQLERYGHSWGPYLQPVISHAHFFLTVPILPYLMGVNPPNECMYTLGYYRPGSCAPYMLDPLPISVRAGLWEAGAWTGAAFLVP